MGGAASPTGNRISASARARLTVGWGEAAECYGVHTRAPFTSWPLSPRRLIHILKAAKRRWPDAAAPTTAAVRLVHHPPRPTL